MQDHVGLAIDPVTNDLFLRADGDLAVVLRAEAVGQHARQRLMTHKTEWFLDTDAGVAWLDQVLGRKPDTVIAEAIIKAEILDTSGVTGISSFSIRFDRDLRMIESYRTSVETIYDEEADL